MEKETVLHLRGSKLPDQREGKMIAAQALRPEFAFQCPDQSQIGVCSCTLSAGGRSVCVWGGGRGYLGHDSQPV